NSRSSRPSRWTHTREIAPITRRWKSNHRLVNGYKIPGNRRRMGRRPVTLKRHGKGNRGGRRALERPARIDVERRRRAGAAPTSGGLRFGSLILWRREEAKHIVQLLHRPKAGELSLHRSFRALPASRTHHRHRLA